MWMDIGLTSISCIVYQETENIVCGNFEARKEFNYPARINFYWRGVFFVTNLIGDTKINNESAYL